MFLGTHTPRLDEKGRLFLPPSSATASRAARHDQGPGALPLVYPADTSSRSPEMQKGPTSSKAVRDYIRVFLAGAHDEVPDRQGRLTVPAPLRQYAGLTRDCTVIGTGNRVEVWDTRPGRPTSGHRARLRRPVAGGGPRTLLSPTALTAPRTCRTAPPPTRDPASSRSPSRDDFPRSGPPGETTRSGWGPDRRSHPDPHPPHPVDPPTEHDAARPEGRPTHDHPRQPGRPARAGAARPGRRAAGARPAAPGAVYVDGTLGMGGHAQAVLERRPQARVVGIDRDHEALALAGERLAPYADRLTLVHAVYDEVAAVAETLGADLVDAALFDLGVSSLQLDEEDRGFAYRVDAPLDMRMDQSAGDDRGPRPQHLRGGRPDADPARLRRGALRPAHRPGRRAPARDGALHDLRPGSSSCCAAPCPWPRSAPVATRPSAPSRRCASRSTASSPPGRPPCPPPSTRSPSAAASPSSATTRSRTASPSRPSRPRAPVELARRAARRAARARALPAPAHPGGRGGERGRGRRQPARRLRAAAGRRARHGAPRPPHARHRHQRTSSTTKGRRG